MDDLVQFLRDRYDEDDATARAASWDGWDGSHWIAHHREQYDGRWAVIDRADEGLIPTVAPQAADDAGVAAHIARHDPARILREVDAKRQIIECHEPWAAGNGDTVCGRCGREHIDGRPGAHFPCQTLRLLALPYSDHPDYKDAWRP